MKVSEIGERDSRKYRGMIFDPVKYSKEVGHVTAYQYCCSFDPLIFYENYVHMILFHF